MWLLDANVDVHLHALLQDLGIRCESAAFRGWKALDNGTLVTAAVQAGFECLLTRDRLFGESAARALRTFPKFAVVVITLPQEPWIRYRASFLYQWETSPIKPVSGSLSFWPQPSALDRNY